MFRVVNLSCNNHVLPEEFFSLEEAQEDADDLMRFFWGENKTFIALPLSP